MTCNYTAEDKNVMRVSAQAKNKSRLQELIDFAKISGFKKIGVANCKGVQELADRFTTEEAYGVSVGIRGGDISNGSVRTMLSRWEQQGMVERIERGVYKKSHYGEV